MKRMGEPIPNPPIEYGNDCVQCTPLRWPANENPKYVYVMFWNLVDCGWSPHPAPNGQIFKLEQVPGTPCLWHKSIGTWVVNWYARRPAGAQSQLNLADHHGWNFFFAISLQCPFEYWTYTNLQAACILMYAASAGFATIWWNSTITELIEGAGLVPGRSLFYELFKAAGNTEVHKFCDLYQRTNIKIKTI